MFDVEHVVDARFMAETIRDLDPFCATFNLPCWFDDESTIMAIHEEISQPANAKEDPNP